MNFLTTLVNRCELVYSNKYNVVNSQFILFYIRFFYQVFLSYHKKCKIILVPYILNHLVIRVETLPAFTCKTQSNRAIFYTKQQFLIAKTFLLTNQRLSVYEKNKKSNNKLTHPDCCDQRAAYLLLI